MRKEKTRSIGFPITLMKVLAIDENGKELFAVPKILVFRSKETMDIGTIGSRDVKNFNFESQVNCYIPSVYGKYAPELDFCVGQIIRGRMEIDIKGDIKNNARGQLKRAKIYNSPYLNDDNGPHTGWIKIIAKEFIIEHVNDKTK